MNQSQAQTGQYDQKGIQGGGPENIETDAPNSAIVAGVTDGNSTPPADQASSND